MFVEDLDRPGLAGLWAEATARPATPPGQDVSGIWTQVAVSDGPRSAAAAEALGAFHCWLEDTRP